MRRHLSENVLRIRKTDCFIQTQSSRWVSLLNMKFIGLSCCSASFRPLSWILISIIQVNAYIAESVLCAWFYWGVCSCSSLTLPKKIPLFESNFPAKKLPDRTFLTSCSSMCNGDVGCSCINEFSNSTRQGCGCSDWLLAKGKASNLSLSLLMQAQSLVAEWENQAFVKKIKRISSSTVSYSSAGLCLCLVRTLACQGERMTSYVFNFVIFFFHHFGDAGTLRYEHVWIVGLLPYGIELWV